MNTELETIATLSETLDTELKDWLDLEDKNHAALLALACIALRNHGGGRVILGVDDATLRPSKVSKPADLAKAYHSDRVNAAVAKFALPKFEVRVEMKRFEGSILPVILVEGGIEFPVITKAALNKIRQNAVYVRSIENGRASSMEPKSPQDWDRLIQKCFDNREADIARFFERHLPGIAARIQKMTGGGVGAPQSLIPEPNPALALLGEGLKRASERVSQSFGDNTNPLKNIGFQEAAFCIFGDFSKPRMSSLLDELFVRQPHLTGWPPWVDSRRFSQDNARPYVKDQGWEAMVYSPYSPQTIGMLDFWRITTDGQFYLLRTLEDDTTPRLQGSGIAPGVLLDFYLVISRTAEIIFTAKAFAEALGTSSGDSKLKMAFKWSRLAGRKLTCWLEPARRIHSGIKAVDDAVTSQLEVDLGTAESEIWQFVRSVTQPVFDVFGYQMSDAVVQDIVDKTLHRSGDS